MNATRLEIESNAMPEKTVHVAGELLQVRADGSLFWPARSTLFVADVHLGKAAAFRAAAIPVPVGTTESVLDRLGHSLDATRANRLVFLGDLWHAREGRRVEILDSIARWRERHASVQMTLVEGNHDLRSGALPSNLRIEAVSEPFADGPFTLCHYPQTVEGRYCLAGHVHPAVTLSGSGRQSLRLPCFWFGEKIGVLPAFGEFTGRATVEPSLGDRVFVLAEGRLHEAKLAEAAS